ncbi:hypothetical protein ID866_7200 [Astraeus odoratus]|nr:hypothetical protein ID866_7200 [Astraeus odoratus]
MSAETGHHFANPTNHFWRCLHRSGLTSVLLPPSEDFSLPDRYNLGLTNIVDRPSAEAAELSKSEMKAAVPTFLQKISQYRPRFVCIVGMGIWEVIQTALFQIAQSSHTSTLGDRKGKARRDFEKGYLGLQSYKLTFPAERAQSETFIFVVPSTSGRVVRYQASESLLFIYTAIHRTPIFT